MHAPVERPKLLRLTSRQREARELLRKPQRHTCLVGGSRSGKTTLFTRSIIARCIQSGGSRHLIARLHGNAVRSSIWLDTFPKVMKLCFPGVRHKTYRQDGFEEFSNGSQVWFGGLDEGDRTEKILGQEYVTIYAVECSQVPYTSVLTMRTRLAQVVPGLRLRGYYDLNPTSIRHWTHVEFGEKLNPITRQPLPDPQNYERFFINPKDNAENLDPEYIQSLEYMPHQFRERFFEGRYVVEIEGALWTSDLLETRRVPEVAPPARGGILPEFTRVVIGVDPSGAQSKFDIKSDEIGIVAAGKLRANKAVVLEDATCRGGPKEWGRAAVGCFRRWNADLIVAEANYGGAMVESTIKAVDENVPVRLVSASRGKVQRAEPIAALYDEGKVGHAGMFVDLEDQLCLFAREGFKGDRSPDRADANIWALSELMIEESSTYTLANVR